MRFSLRWGRLRKLQLWRRQCLTTSSWVSSRKQ
jgi:hypothetical protein